MSWIRYLISVEIHHMYSQWNLIYFNSLYCPCYTKHSCPGSTPSISHVHYHTFIHQPLYPLSFSSSLTLAYYLSVSVQSVIKHSFFPLIDYLILQGNNLPFPSVFNMLAYFCFHQAWVVHLDIVQVGMLCKICYRKDWKIELKCGSIV